MFACLPYGASVSGVAPLRQLGSGQRAVIIGEHFKNGGFSFIGLMIFECVSKIWFPCVVNGQNCILTSSRTQ